MVEQKVMQYDLIVVGAGMVGAAFSCLLARGNPPVADRPDRIPREWRFQQW